MKHNIFFATLLIFALAALTFSCKQPQQKQEKTPAFAGEPDRTILPVTEPVYPLDSILDARNAKAPARFEVKAPAKGSQCRDRAD